MLTQICNIHHSKLPAVGAIGYITNGTTRYNEILYYQGQRIKWQCIYYSLNDNVGPYSLGIHTAFFKNLKNGEIKQFAGQYFDELPN